MRVADICTRRVIQATPDMPLMEAAGLMRRHQVGTLVVTTPAQPSRPVGMITDRDIAVGAVADGANPAQARVADVMATSVVTCGEEDELFDVVQMMRSRGVRRLPVVDRKDELVGVLSADDVMASLAEYLLALARTASYAPPQDSAVSE